MMAVFFFKQKTAYEMRISDWSSDVCSSDLDESSWRGRANVAYESADELLKAKFGGLVRSTTREFLSRQTNYTATGAFTYLLSEVDKAGPSELIRSGERCVRTWVVSYGRFWG